MAGKCFHRMPKLYRLESLTRSSFLRTLVGCSVATAAGVLALLTLQPRALTAQVSQAEGRLQVVWEDPPAGPGRALFYLVEDDGTWTRLRLGELARQQLGTPGFSEGRRVSVDGTRVQAEPGVGETAFDVDAIQPSLQAQVSIPYFSAGGNGPWVTILCRFKGSNSTPHDPSWYDAVTGSAYPGTADFWSENSYGQQNLSGSIVVGWYELPDPQSAYMLTTGPNLTKARRDCTEAADADVDFSRYEGVNLQFNADLGCCSYGGSNPVNLDGDGKVFAMTWMAPWADQKTYAHEMGHGIGFGHSSGPYGDTYDSDWDVMSGGSALRDGTYGRIPPHTISFHKNLAGWIPDANKYVATPGSTQRIHIARLADLPSGGYQMAQIPVTDSSFYTVETRQVYGYDEAIPGEAVVLHHVKLYRSSGIWAHVVDADGDGDPNDAGAMWLPGETFTDAQAGVIVRVEARTASGYDVTISLDGDGTDPAPVIALTPTALSYATMEGTNPSDQSFSVTNGGGGTLDYTVSKDRSWLGVSRTSGSLGAGASHDVTVSVDASGLAAGDYNGTVTVGGNAPNAPRTVTVSLTVSAQEPDPVIALTPGALTYETTEGTNPSDQSFSVTNDGGGTLDYTVSKNRSWLGVSRTTGSLGAGASQNVTVSVDASGLAVGSYSGTVTVGGNAPNAPQTIDVSVTVAEAPSGPWMSVGPGNLTFQIKGNKAPGRQRFGIGNQGAEALSWNAQSSPSWLRLDHSSGSVAAGATDSVGVDVSISGLEPGTYDGEITLSGNAGNAPQTVAVQLKLSKGGVVKLKKGRLTFAGSEEEQPLAKAVTLENDGDDSATWSATANESWVELESASGTLAAGETRFVGLSVSVTGLAAGLHTAQVEFTGGDDGIPDTLTIEVEVSDGPGVSHAPDQVAAELLGDNSALTGAEVHYIDFVGNGNGRFDVGDLRAWLIQTGRLRAAPFGSFSAQGEDPGDGMSGEGTIGVASPEGRE